MTRASAGPAGLRRHSLTLALLSVPAVVVVRPASLQVSAIPADASPVQAHAAQSVAPHVPVSLRPIAIPSPAGYGASPVLLGSARRLPIDPARPAQDTVPARKAASHGTALQVAYTHPPALPATPASAFAPGKARQFRPLATSGHAASGPGIQRWSSSGGLLAPTLAMPAPVAPAPRKATRAYTPDRAVAQATPPASTAPARRAQRAFAGAAPTRFDAAAQPARTYVVASDAWQPATARMPQMREASSTQATRWAAAPTRSGASRLARDTVWVDPTGLFAGAQAAMLAAGSTSAATSAATNAATGGVQRFGAAATSAALSASLAADAPAASGNPQVDSLLSGHSDPALQLRPYVYVPAPARQEEAQRPPAQQRLVELNLNGQYARLGREGLALMKKEQLDDELKFIIANGLAWSGRLHAAERIYQDLLDGDQALNARVALANIHRWRGKDYLAASMYKEVLATDGAHAEALEGLALTRESARPRLRVSSTRTTDSYDVRTQNVAANYRWTTHGGARVTEVEFGGMAARMPRVSSGEVLLAARHQAHDVRMDPAVEVSFGKQMYGSVSVQPVPALPVRVRAGKVNWAAMSLNPRGMEKALSANNLGLTATVSGRPGRAALVADSYRVSDGNSVQTAMLRYSPAVKLFTPRLRPVLGVEYRKARFDTPDYWSPAQGYGVAFAGVEGEWSTERSSTTAALQRGWRIHGEAGPAWSASLSHTYKVNDDWSVGGSAWLIENKRDGGRYNASAMTVFVERRW